MYETNPQRLDARHAFVGIVDGRILGIGEAESKKTAKKITAKRTILALFGEAEAETGPSYDLQRRRTTTTSTPATTTPTPTTPTSSTTLRTNTCVISPYPRLLQAKRRMICSTLISPVLIAL